MKNDILLGIIITLLNEGKSTYNELAEKFEVSKKTIQRYCLSLEMSGVPTLCTYGRNGGIEIMGSFSLDKMFFSTEELNRLLSSLHATPLTAYDHIDRQIEEKLTLKCKDLNSLNNFMFDFSDWQHTPTQNPVVKILDDGITSKGTFNMSYLNSTGVESTRIISPYKLIFKDSKWYLLAYCHKNNDTRLFKINRIQELSPANANYVKLNLNEAEIKEKINNAFNEINITLSVSNSMISDVCEWLQNSKITENNNGSAIVTGTAIDNNELISKIISFPSHVKLLAPECLVTRVTEKVKSLTKNYC